ncbi:uncharacterized protein MELLADRAFT_48789 [Melampsora larici-populina 98AG31]|uniref:Oxysterol binding protein n=1 Tax=Melampsora larici-populina (strain 98AG31 / pathotype 3-4-7) TaxID=747676 RepID=F4RQM7_MELLP|nr:uncharacterized protein MELLADRAFT_48789 [Melampsora larici-populina 98AG31]EGG05486.1 hypothetical protein MELLADRAFT_48789 [Melampsora larici-populina 98AG31]
MALEDHEEPTAVPTQQKSSWSSFLKAIATFSGDLSSLTAPSFILSPTSLCEFPSYWGEPYEEFSLISTGQTPEERMVLVLRWFIATLKGQFTRRETQTGSEKKPLNPILGELFLGTWNGGKDGIQDLGEIKLWAEQVSHHPPVSAYFLSNSTSQVSYQGHCAQKTSFSGKSVIVKQVGHGIVRITLPDGTVESYLVTLPKLRIEGLLLGSPYVELIETSHIQSSTGYHAVIDYKGKGYFSGKPHTFIAKIYSSPESKKSIYHIEGQWNGISKFVKEIPCFFKSSGGSQEIFLDQTEEKHLVISVKDLDQQDVYESRKVWKDVADGIRKGDFESASAAKSKLENEQRSKRKEEVANGTPWQMKYFKKVDVDEEYASLAEMCGHTPVNQEGYYFKVEES